MFHPGQGGKLYCLIGKSASGKDSIYRLLMEDPSLSLKPVVTCTTRPKRDGEEDGREYHFVSEDEMHAMEDAGLVAESRVYHTVYGDWYYFTEGGRSLDLSEGDRLMIATLEAFASLKAYLGEEKTVPLYITLDDGERLERALNRERAQKEPKYKEMCRRFLADEEDFSDEKLRAAGIGEDAFFENDDLASCHARIREMMLSDG
ncbi:MAG: guanylate kinase [Lachnospiraceae bacterium]|nr:guanylate kinase [Lachnospiraceae bacterium]MCR4938057.1 guanylate kinase [Lachnospiraceae bacterium]